MRDANSREPAALARNLKTHELFERLPGVSAIPQVKMRGSATNLFLRLRDRYHDSATRLLFRRPFTIQTPSPLISFTFDDFPRSALLVGGLVLNRFNASGTYYISLGLLGKKAPTGEIATADDLQSLLEQGHELGCHTFSHCDPLTTKPAQYEASVIDNRTALSRLIPGAVFRSFAYPSGSPRPLAKARVARHFLCCRGGGQIINTGTVDLNRLSAFFLEKRRNEIQAVKRMIDLNRELQGWLIFATHDVAENPTPFGCTPEFFGEVVEYAVRSGCHILPVVRALRVLRASKPEGSPVFT